MNRLFLLDGMALVYRAHFALINNPIRNSKGMNTSAIYGFTNTLLTILEKEKPTHIGIAFDTSAPTSRHKVFPEYKAQRDEMPEELALAIPHVKRMCEAFDIPILELDGYEADDIIGTLTTNADTTGEFESFMVTPDKDFAQLVSKTTTMWKPGRKGSDHEILDLAATLEKWDVERTEQVIDILGLWGDSSDNIPGVPGIGEKTAKKLLKTYDNVENLLKHTHELKGKQKENLETFADQARLSRELARIITDVPIEVSFEQLKLSALDQQKAQDLFAEFEFRSLTKRLFGHNLDKSSKQLDSSDNTEEETLETFRSLADTKHNYTFVKSKKDEAKLLKALQTSKRFCFDLETTSLDPRTTKILGIAFSVKKGQAFFLPVHKEPNIPSEILAEFTSRKEKIGHNLKFDLSVLKAQKIEYSGPFVDTMLIHTLVDPQQKHSMDYLAETLLGYQTVKLADLAEKIEQEQGGDDLFSFANKKKTANKSIDMEYLAQHGMEQLAEYACEDADITLQLADLLIPKLKEAQLDKVYTDIEAPLLPVLVTMENEGIAIDLPSLEIIAESLQKRIDTLASVIRETAGREFNLNSPKQLGEILFEEMQLIEKPKKTKTGQYKTDEQTLSNLANDHQIVADILEYRESAKLKNTYVDALPKHISPATDRIHSSFHQLLTSTGRLASSDPNIQNIPIRTEAGREIRKAFVPRNEDYTLLAADYSQIELRIMAALSEDKAMIDAFTKDIDIHTVTASKVHHVTLDEVTSDMRRTAKMVNFGIIYGISAFGLSQRLGIPRKEASAIIDAYFEQYPSIAAFMEKTITEATEKGFVETLGGRRRYFPELQSSNKMIKSNAERAAINTPIQGTAADMIKLAMVQIDSLLENYKTSMLLQVHDELVFDLHKEEEEELTPKIIDLMQNALPLPHGIPAKVEIGTGSNWLKAH